MTTRLTGVDGERIIRDSLEEGDGKVSVLQVSPEVLGKYIKIASDDPDLVDEVRVLADTEVLKEVMDDFLVSSAASDLLNQGKLSLYSSSDGERRSLVVVDDSAVVSYTNLDGGVGALSSEDDDLVDSVTEVFESLWETGDEFTVRTPPMSKVRETLSEEIGEGTEKDFSEILRVLDTAKGDGEGLDE
ncbi:MAG: DUF5821 family protein, partial [Halobacteria archaeon]|nr:DUF5821 family protein [Halobacteria archaeon]